MELKTALLYKLEDVGYFKVNDMELLKPKAEDENLKYISGIIQAFEKREPAIAKSHTWVLNT